MKNTNAQGRGSAGGGSRRPRRSSQRLRASRRVDFEVNGQQIFAYTRDIGRGGMSLSITSPLAKEAELDFSIALDAKAPPVVIRGKVRRVVDAPRGGGVTVAFPPKGQDGARDTIGTFVLSMLEAKALSRLQLDSRDVRALKELGDIASERGDTDQALAYYEQACANDGADLDLRCHCADLLLAKATESASEELLRRATEAFRALVETGAKPEAQEGLQICEKALASTRREQTLGLQEAKLSARERALNQREVEIEQYKLALYEQQADLEMTRAEIEEVQRVLEDSRQAFLEALERLRLEYQRFGWNTDPLNNLSSAVSPGGDAPLEGGTRSAEIEAANGSAAAHSQARAEERLSYDTFESLRFAAEGASSLLSRLQGIKIDPLDPRSADAAADALRGLEPVCQAVTDATKLLTTLIDYLGAPHHEGPASQRSHESQDVELDFDLSGSPPAGAKFPSQEEVDASLRTLFAAEPGDPEAELKRLREDCAVCIAELRDCSRHLREPSSTRLPSATLEEAEELHRKTVVALRHILGSTRRILGAHEPEASEGGDESEELETALRVRTFLLDARRRIKNVTLRTPRTECPELEEVLASACAVMSDIIEAQSFAQLRWPDRRCFAQFRQRFLAVLAQEPGSERPRQVLSDLDTFAELLTQVNGREELVTHDRRIKQECLADLQDLASILATTPVGGWERYREVLNKLLKMVGRSPCLDEHVQREIAMGHAPAPPLAQRTSRLTELLLQVAV